MAESVPDDNIKGIVEYSTANILSFIVTVNCALEELSSFLLVIWINQRSISKNSFKILRGKNL